MKTKLTRRQIGLAALGAPLLAQAQSQSAYTGALDGFLDKVDPNGFDPVYWTRERYKSAPLKMTFNAESKRQAEAWQKRLRGKLTELVGGFPASTTALRPRTLETREFPAYTREKFVFESRPGLWVLGYLLTPKAGKAPFANVICLPGHGRGVDDIVGIDDQGRDRTKREGYQFDFAIQAVEHGMAAVAIEVMSFGCRRDPITRKGRLTASACQPTAGAALLLGETMIGWRVYDVMRTVDWIQTRKELDAERVGVMGISGGGMATAFSAALDQRLKVAMVSGYLNTFRDSVFSLSHCIDNYVPGILNWCEMYDMFGLVAPRPMLCESGTRDNIFPIAASKESFARVRKVYDMLGAADMVEHEVFEGEHSFHGVRGLPFLAKHLRA